LQYIKSFVIIAITTVANVAIAGQHNIIIGFFT